MAAEEKKRFTDKKDYAQFPERWADKNKFKDMPAGWNPPHGEELEKFRKKRKGQMADISWDMLEYEELPVSSAPLMSAAQFIGVECRSQSQDFLICKRDKQDPRMCLNEGKAVSDCARAFLLKVRDHCRKEFRQHWSCLDNRNLDHEHCLKHQPALDKCILEHTGLERPTPPPRGMVMRNF
ncbi:NADH dehydrogenase [ubiquinone] 1 alpha subcomplex subunit 8-like [Sycon ciliatum]|uniref:NADH dehydrogenase [ubiquinone] 1 alpha subcomplex subunit 8-like n=1 Tax=Sycon ciliatum TaxID=27933 RepID=UPI0020AA0A9A|eukprot:scpid63229/ scgid24092/ NADH dehydrogenase [ubiquinone] 1 alpha subcomplex subunit 8; Complex I-19kD; Complex I-PGIV; NADH-ubiquinone oxidoreductase 19 kDa subunit